MIFPFSATERCTRSIHFKVRPSEYEFLCSVASLSGQSQMKDFLLNCVSEYIKSHPEVHPKYKSPNFRDNKLIEGGYDERIKE